MTLVTVEEIWDECAGIGTSCKSGEQQKHMRIWKVSTEHKEKAYQAVRLTKEER